LTITGYRGLDLGAPADGVGYDVGAVRRSGTTGGRIGRCLYVASDGGGEADGVRYCVR